MTWPVLPSHLSTEMSQPFENQLRGEKRAPSREQSVRSARTGGEDGGRVGRDLQAGLSVCAGQVARVFAMHLGRGGRAPVPARAGSLVWCVCVVV